MLPAKRRRSQAEITAEAVAAAVAAEKVLTAEAVAAEKALTAEAVAAAVAIAQTVAAETAAAIAKTTAETTAAAIAAAQTAAASAVIANATAAANAITATSAAAAASTREQNWLCSVCKELYDKPTSSPCGHTFCLSCIKAALAVKEECPNCRAKVSRTLPLAVNIAMQEFIAENAGPLFVARKAEKSDAFYKALLDLHPGAAIAALSSDVDLRRFVGDAALKLTPLLWACKNADGALAIEWNNLIKALLTAGADVNARDSGGQSALYLAANSYSITTSTNALPALLDHGARDPSALSLKVRDLLVSSTVERINTVDAILLRMAEDASYSYLSLTQKREDLANMLKNGYDRTAVALFDKKVRLVQPLKMLIFAASGGCDIFIRKLLAANIVKVTHVFAHDQTALHVACYTGKANAALALLQCGANLNNFGHDDFNYTPLYYARKMGMDEVVNALKAKGCTS